MSSDQKINCNGYVVIYYIEQLCVCPFKPSCQLFVEIRPILTKPFSPVPQGGFSSLVKSLRTQCIELLTEIEARLDFEDEMPPLDVELIVNTISSMSRDVEHALETANYDKLLQSGLQVDIAMSLTSDSMQFGIFVSFRDRGFLSLLIIFIFKFIALRFLF